MICISSCKKSNVSDLSEENFKGLGNLTIGREFSKLNHKEHFDLNSELQMISYDSVYCIAKYDINKEFGIIENLNVGVKDGKIFWIYFKSGPYTNNSNIKNKFDKLLFLKPKEANNKSSGDDYFSKSSIKGYISYGKEDYTYSFVDDEILNKIRNTEDSIFKSIEQKQFIQAKKKYMENMPK